MDSIMTYMVKASIALALFYALYIILFRDDTFFRLRRSYFLFTIFFSLIFPLINIEIPAEEQGAPPIPVYWLSDFEVGGAVVESAGSQPVSIWTIVFICMSVISLLYAIRFLIQLVSVAKLKINSNSEEFGTYKIIKINNKEISPFSFFKWIFINQNILETKDVNEIIAHEQVHIKQFHFIDVMLSEILCICFWWNPVVWLLKREVKINLEYLADEGVLQGGYDSKEYQYALLQVSNKNTGIPIINHFNVSQLKKESL